MRWRINIFNLPDVPEGIMIIKWCVSVSSFPDVPEGYSFIVGPFDSREEAWGFSDELGLVNFDGVASYFKRFNNELPKHETITTVRPYIQAMNWVGHERNEPIQLRSRIEKATMYALGISL